jgi:CBS-domain-containing membrane protein
MRRFGFFIISIVIAVALAWLCNIFGLWWATTVLGFLLGILLRGKGAFGAAVLVGGLGWGLPLLLQALHTPVGQVAATVAVLVGLVAAGGWLIVLLTVLLGVLLCVAGTWLGVALRGLVAPVHQKVPEDVEHGF